MSLGGVRSSAVRRCGFPCGVATPRGFSWTVVASVRVFSLHPTAVRHARGRELDKEDQEELNREAALRQKFAQKQQQRATPASMGELWESLKASSAQVAQQQQHAQQQQQTTGSSATSSGSDGQQQQQQQQPNFGGINLDNMKRFQQGMLRATLYITGIYAIFVLWQLNKEGSTLNNFQGIPWWAEPIDVVVNFLLMRVLLPFNQQVRMKGEFETATRANPQLTFSQFIQQRYPGLFNGSRVTHDQLVAAMSACFALSHDLQFAESMKRAASGASNTAAACDLIWDALQRDFPQVFAPVQSAPAPMPMGGGGGFATLGSSPVAMDPFGRTPIA